MVATSLGLDDSESVFAVLDGEEADPFGTAHLELREAFEEAQEFLHPWAREMYERGLSFNGNERSKLYLGRGDGTFEDLSDLTGAESPLDGRALVAADFDDDGDLDLFAHNIQRERHNLYRNELDPRGFLKLRLEATRTQHEAIGAEVSVDGPRGPVAQVVSRGAGFSSCDPPELVFGLGAAPGGAVRVRWPSGATESFGTLRAGGRFLLVEGAGEARAVEGRTTRLADPLPDGLKLGVGERVPTLVLTDSGGAEVALDPVTVAEGGTLVLAFWASYCRPCLTELPALAELHGREGVSVAAISVDVPDDRQRALRALSDAGAAFPSYFLAMDEKSNEGRLDELVDLLRLPIPTSLVLGPEGRILEVRRGPVLPD